MSYSYGQVADIPDEDAQAVINCGKAERVKDEKKAETVVETREPEVETRDPKPRKK